MLTAQSVAPSTVLQPFIHWYVQRETAPNDAAIIEPVLPRAGAMLEFQFDSVYDVKALGTDTLRPSWAATVIGPIDAHRVRLILRGSTARLVPPVRCASLTADGSGHRGTCGVRAAGLLSLSTPRQCGKLRRTSEPVGRFLPSSDGASSSARSNRSRHASTGLRLMQCRRRSKDDRDQRAPV
jgi:hypothetical protein